MKTNQLVKAYFTLNLETNYIWEGYTPVFSYLLINHLVCAVQRALEACMSICGF